VVTAHSMTDYLDSDTWFFDAANLIQSQINSVIQKQGFCNVMLTGGRTAEAIYFELGRLEAFLKLNNTNFYFGDERCVPKEHPENIFSMSMRTLFYGKEDLFKNKIHKINSDAVDLDAAAAEYSSILPNNLDILLLSIGDDGHIASLFPKSSALLETDRKVLSVIGNKSPYARFTISPKVILSASTVFVFCKGKAKHKIYECANRDPANFFDIPARLVLNRNWLL